MKKKKPNSHPEPTPPDPNAIRSTVAWILEANKLSDIKDSLQKVFPKLNQAQRQAAIEAAVKEISSAADEDPEFTRGWCIAATKEIARKMNEIGDYAGALAAIRQLQKLTDC